MAMNEIHDGLNPWNTKRQMSEHPPRFCSQEVSLAIAAAKKKLQHISGKFLHLLLIEV
jgi:hypothetical protein